MGLATQYFTDKGVTLFDNVSHPATGERVTFKNLQKGLPLLTETVPVMDGVARDPANADPFMESLEKKYPEAV